MMRAIGIVLRVGLAALLVWAGVAKLLDPKSFSEEVANYRLYSQLAPALATMLPSIEITTGLALVLSPRLWQKAAALLALVLLVVFTGAVASAWLRGIDVRCGCFGTGGGPITGWTVLRDVGFVTWATLVLRYA
jgi:uncharacterized membrane protein YphA (DoxX/SURF4 family)